MKKKRKKKYPRGRDGKTPGRKGLEKDGNQTTEGNKGGSAPPPEPAKTIHPVYRAILRVLLVLLGILCLLSPLWVPVFLWYENPRFYVIPFERFTGRFGGFVVSVKNNPGEFEKLTPEEQRAFKSEVAERFVRYMAIEAIVRTYNAWLPGLLLATAICALALALYLGLPRILPGPFGSGRFQGAVFLLLAAVASFAWGVPSALWLAAALTAVFVLNFPLSDWIAGAVRSNRLGWAGLVLCLAAPYLAHVFAPTGVLVLLAWCLQPSSVRLRKIALAAGRLLACTCSFTLLAVLFLSQRPTPLSPTVSQLLNVKDLYDVEVDPRGNQVITTIKDIKLKYPEYGYVLRLDDPHGSKVKFEVPSIELEDIAVDSDLREVYHIVRDSGSILVWDADAPWKNPEIRMKRVGKLRGIFGGTAVIALLRSHDLLFVSYENGASCLIDRKTLTQRAVLRTDGWMTPFADDKNGLFYLIYDESAGRAMGVKGRIEILDPETFEITKSVPCPATGDKMAYSDRRQELYVPGSKESQVWVYSRPDLELKRKIPTQLGVRAMAVDDERGLLLAHSVVSGYVSVIDLETGKTLARHYAGKYGRVMALDTERRHAYITIARSGLYLVKY